MPASRGQSRGKKFLKNQENFALINPNSARQFCNGNSFYLFTCEYCFSHYVTILFLFITKFHLLYEGWRGYLISGFALVWIANVYMSVFGFIRVGMKKEKMDADIEELKLKKEKEKL